MKDRQQVAGGGISQQEVLAATCPVNNAIVSFPNLKVDLTASNYNQQQFMPQQQLTTTKAITTTNKPFFKHSNNVYLNEPAKKQTRLSPCLHQDLSSKFIRCSPQDRMHGFAPDNTDCSKYYRCSQNVGIDGKTSLGNSKQ
jgi:hypothetical protein